ncbi:MAG TPA: sigma-70 domain-containing protein [Polyangiaceae bacterium]|nr:sigma-70 domain-containing protein [Polyangiaceae bacterium]
MTHLRADLRELLDRLLRSASPVLGLDHIAEEVGDRAISFEEIDALFAALEAAGKTIGDPTRPPASTHLPLVLTTARALKRELGRTPRSAEIAERAGLTHDQVRLALLFARMLQR